MHKRIVTTALIALAVSSCQKKASGQTVAVVNNQEITKGDLNAALANDPAVAGSGTEQARQAELQKLIDRTLLVQEAKSQGIDKSPEYLNQLRATTDNLLVGMLLQRQLKTAQVPSAPEISSFEAKHPQMFAGRETWTLSQIVYPSPKDPAINAKLKATNSLDGISQILTSNGIQFTKNTNKIDTAAVPDDIYAQVERLSSGTPFIVNGPQTSVANVITAREPNPTSTDQSRTLALQAMRRQQVGGLVQQRVKSLRTTAKIEYQPGFSPGSKSSVR